MSIDEVHRHLAEKNLELLDKLATSERRFQRLEEDARIALSFLCNDDPDTAWAVLLSWFASALPLKPGEAPAHCSEVRAVVEAARKFFACPASTIGALHAAIEALDAAEKRALEEPIKEKPKK